MNKSTQLGNIQPYPGWLTTDLPGTSGVIRAQPEDFVVQEIPAYGPTGEGQHTLFEIRKTGLTTMEAINRLAKSWHVPKRMIGSAGLKDKHAVTQQHLSVEGVSPEVVRTTHVEGIEILWAERHRNRLKIGHLRGNRFRIRIRDVSPGSLAVAQDVLARLRANGVPNGFGPQRFGIRQTSHILGHALLCHDANEFIRAMLGDPKPTDPEEMQKARRLVDEGDLTKALAQWRPAHGPEYHLLRSLAKGDDPAKALGRIPRHMGRLYVSAYQSFLFNQIVALRLSALGKLEAGDLAIKHVNGAYFAVEDPTVEQARADRLEISPSGALFGRKPRIAGGRPGEYERMLMTQHGMTPALWKSSGSQGGRRPLRVPLQSPTAQEDDQGLVVSFELPPGSYATNVMGEITKSG